MKHSILLAICLSVVTAFAGPYDISDFSAQDVGSPDDYITAEFGGELKIAPVEEVESLQEGRLVVRQKFVDPFDASAISYQLYQGGAGDLSSMTALSVPEGTSYSDIVKAKMYKQRTAKADDDVEKVYFDGKSVYSPNVTTLFAFVNGNRIELKGDAPAEETPVEAAPVAKKSSYDDEEECDEDDEDCEEEDYDVAGNLDNTNDEADSRDYAASDAAYDASGENATDRFGIADEVRFWAGVGLSVIAGASAVMGIIQHMKANEAQDAYDELDEIHSDIYGKYYDACKASGQESVDACMVAMKYYEIPDANGYSMATLESRMKTNKNTRDSYATARNIWFGVSGAAIAGAVVLFVW